MTVQRLYCQFVSLYLKGAAMQATKQESRLRLINANELADILGISMRHLWRMKAAGELPKPVHLRNSVRWVLSDIERWLSMGCPSKTKFEAHKSTKAKAKARRNR